jgi:hypothetical protein
VSDICLKFTHHGCLTVDSVSEAIALANGAIQYITSHGIDDIIFRTYFGFVQNAHPQLAVFGVRPGYPDSSAFLIAQQFNSGRCLGSPHLELLQPFSDLYDNRHLRVRCLLRWYRYPVCDHSLSHNLTNLVSPITQPLP